MTPREECWKCRLSLYTRTQVDLVKSSPTTIDCKHRRRYSLERTVQSLRSKNGYRGDEINVRQMTNIILVNIPRGAAAERSPRGVPAGGSRAQDLLLPRPRARAPRAAWPRGRRVERGKGGGTARCRRSSTPRPSKPGLSLWWLIGHAADLSCFEDVDVQCTSRTYLYFSHLLTFFHYSFLNLSTFT